MKIKALTLTIIFTLALSSALLVNLANANWLIMPRLSPPSKPEIQVLLPEPNRTYSTNIGVDFLVVGPDWADLRNYIKTPTVSYSLDNKTAVPFIGEQVTSYDSSDLIFHFWGNLTKLSNGAHSIEFIADCEGKYSPKEYKLADFKTTGISAKIYFTVDSTISDSRLPKVTIISPKNEVYRAADIPVSFEVSEQCSQIKYALDGQSSVPIEGKNATLTGLSDGVHNLAVFATDLKGNTQSTVTNFTVNIPTAISLISPQKQTYYSTNVTLTFICNKMYYPVTYRLDNETFPTSGNTTLTNLTIGDHSISLYTWDKESRNNVYSETVDFTVAEPFPTTLVATASVASVAIVGIGLFCYFKKRKSDEINNPPQQK